MKIKANQHGFSVLETVLVIVVVALISTAGLLVYKNQQKDSATPVASTSSASAQATKKSTKGLYNGWKQYCSTAEKSCFKYPSFWNLKDSCTESVACYGAENISITSPKDTIIGFTSSIAGLGGDCDPAVPFIYTKVTPEQKVPGLYVVEGTRQDIEGTVIGLKDSKNGQAPKLGDSGTCFLYLNFTAKNTPNAGASLSGTVNNKDDLSDARLILQSYYYQ